MLRGLVLYTLPSAHAVAISRNIRMVIISRVVVMFKLTVEKGKNILG